MPRPCQVSQRPGSASTYSPWRRSRSWRSSATCVSGSGRAPQISHSNMTETGISPPWLVATGELIARCAPVRLAVVPTPDRLRTEAAEHRPVGEPGPTGPEEAERVGVHERHELVRKARHRARRTDPPHVRAATDAADPATEGDVAARHRPLAAELDQASAVVGRCLCEFTLLGEAGAAAALLHGPAEQPPGAPVRV